MTQSGKCWKRSNQVRIEAQVTDLTYGFYAMTIMHDNTLGSTLSAQVLPKLEERRGQGERKSEELEAEVPQEAQDLGSAYKSTGPEGQTLCPEGYGGCKSKPEGQMLHPAGRTGGSFSPEGLYQHKPDLEGRVVPTGTEGLVLRGTISVSSDADPLPPL